MMKGSKQQMMMALTTEDEVYRAESCTRQLSSGEPFASLATT